MGFINNIRNIFVTRSFVERTITKEKEEALKEAIGLVSENVRDLVGADLRKITDDYFYGYPVLFRDINAVNFFLHEYYGKQSYGDYTTHYISYYYAPDCGYINLGDYIQTIATEEAIKRAASIGHQSVSFEYVLRSSLTNHCGGTCVMQGWYEHQQLTFLPGPDTRPVWVGTHFCSDTRAMLKRLFAYSRIHYNDLGCRDKSTMRFCQSLGISAYFSRCLTLTLPKRAVPEAEKAKTIYIVDCTDEIIDFLPTSLKEGAKFISQRTYNYASWKDWRQCRTAAENLLEEYKAQAKLVITTALHCAQPCLAMGIPVVFINPDYNEEDRFSSMDGIIKQYSIKELKEGHIVFEVKSK